MRFVFQGKHTNPLAVFPVFHGDSEKIRESGLLMESNDLGAVLLCKRINDVSMPIETELQQRFEQCVDNCADSLFRVAYRLTGNRTLASELVQETYLSAWKSISGLKDPERMKAWMFAILRNQYSKLIRKESRSTPTSEHLDSIAMTTKTEDTTTDMIQAAVACLDENHKLPVLLVSMEGLTVDEAARILDLPRGTVLSRLHRGRQKLKEIVIREQSRVAGKEGSDGV